jgi:hypothetical protein
VTDTTAFAVEIIDGCVIKERQALQGKLPPDIKKYVVWTGSKDLVYLGEFKTLGQAKKLARNKDRVRLLVLMHKAQWVVSNWNHGDLAGAVTSLGSHVEWLREKMYYEEER